MSMSSVSEKDTENPQPRDGMETTNLSASSTGACRPSSDAVSPAEAPSATSSSTQPYRYPNPGYLGLSSHSALFSQVFSSDEGGASPRHVPQQSCLASPIDLIGNQGVMDRAMHALSFLDHMDISEVTPLLRSWLEKGVNLPLAGPIVSECLWSVEHWKNVLTPNPSSREVHLSGPEITSAGCVAALLANTLKPLEMNSNLTKHEFLAQMVESNLRWETFGIFFAAAARAAYDTPSFPPLYTVNEHRRRLIQRLTYISDCCLDTSLALDCLNDLQLILQYENFIVHSQIDGDESYHSWRRIGDLSSSLFALGYHESVEESNPNVPSFVVDLRKACFARIYTADKSLAVFLGRPPRISKDYCHFRMPPIPDGWIDDHPQIGESSSLQSRNTNDDVTEELEPINYTADTRVTEDIMLDYLHILFLLGLVSEPGLFGPNDDLLMVATEMLSIVVEVIILRDQLVNSGSCLIWKVAQYGLPAAGVISLALLKATASDMLLHSRSKMIQDLSVLVAEIKTGAWIQAGEPNFALFTRATRTIQALLDSLLAARPVTAATQTSRNEQAEIWEPYTNHQVWDFEMEFWSNLAEHPTLLG
ncbi:hypothetical protein J7T55_003310 [Diaporthe amygdali]|uniref:uncharacterized protein n=1 Tax=Phomopsis amygdali TaxID=1214568 RepID=UPI0022FE0503|nr:uncharacterized protein J7T55_003310 [Diaporthe amygdali]KAJ0116896.1 hypothetical protein J7T55_003310 [Diaporthe amygdali]